MPKRTFKNYSNESDESNKENKYQKTSNISLTETIKQQENASIVQGDIKSITKLAQKFSYQIINNTPHFVLSVKDAEQGNACYHKLKLNLNKLKINEELFKWDENNLEITVTQKDFIKWQKAFISLRHAALRKIWFNQRTFFKGDECYFSIPIGDENLLILTRSIKKSLKTRSIKVKVLRDEELQVAKISSNQYLELLNLTQEESSKKKIQNKKEVRTSGSLKQNAKKRAPSIHHRSFFEKADCYATKPATAVGETVNDLLLRFQEYINERKLKVQPYINEELGSVCFSKEDYNSWQVSKETVTKNTNTDESLAFIFDNDSKRWCIAREGRRELQSLYQTLTRQCEKYNLPKNYFKLNGEKISITQRKYEIFSFSRLEYSAKAMKAYGWELYYDDKSGCYLFEKHENAKRSLITLAKLLGLDVNFVQAEKQVRLSPADYQKWITHPVIKKSYEKDSLTEEEKDVSYNRKCNLKESSAMKVQTASYMNSGISVKYIENAISIPFETQEGEDHKYSLNQKGRVIPFQKFESVLRKTKVKGFVHKIKLDLSGINSNVNLYLSDVSSMKKIFSKNTVFIRAGRKEAALIPMLDNHEQTTIIVIMTTKEYDELEAKCIFLNRRLPSGVILSVIDSCSAQNQIESNAANYLHTSNVKRMVAFSLAKKYKVKNFILMDDNTTQIQLAEKISDDASITSLFKLFAQYSAKGTICATLGSYAPYKNITNPLEATEITSVNERLGSKIMYVDFATILNKLEEKNLKLCELFSPCSLWWGEDYFNMLSMINLMENEQRKAVMGVVPYSVAWHIRSQAQQNLTKNNSKFKLANTWINEGSQVLLENVSVHQKHVVTGIQNIVHKAIADQKHKENLYLNKLQKNMSENVGEENEDDNNDGKIVITEVKSESFEKGVELGQKAANRGYPLNQEKLSDAAESEYIDESDISDYIDGFVEGHQNKWKSLSQDARAFGRGYQEGYSAATKGYAFEGKLMSVIPTLYQDEKLIYQKGFERGHHVQWSSMSEKQKQEALDLLARQKVIAQAIKMGTDRANTAFPINEQKLEQFAKVYEGNATLFKMHFKKAYQETSVKLAPDEVVKFQAIQLAKELSKQKLNRLNMSKLNEEAKMKGPYAELYKHTVISTFNQVLPNNAIVENDTQTSRHSFTSK